MMLRTSLLSPSVNVMLVLLVLPSSAMVLDFVCSWLTMRMCAQVVRFGRKRVEARKKDFQMLSRRNTWTMQSPSEICCSETAVAK